MSITPTRRGAFSGTTKRTLDNSCLLGADCWHEGMTLTVLWQREFTTKYGMANDFVLVEPAYLEIVTDQFGHSTLANESNPDRRKITRFALPPMAGFDMAVQDMMTMGFDHFRYMDKLIISCVGIQKASKADYSDMPMFELTLDPRG